LEYKSPVSPAIDCANLETLKVTINNNSNTGAGSFFQGKFKSCEFFAPQKDKIYLNSTASDPDGLEGEGPVELEVIKLPGASNILGDPTFELEAITFDPTNMPNYIWEIVSGNNILLDVNENSYANSRATARINPDNRQPGPSWVKIDDEPNNSWTQIQFEVKEVALSPIAYYPFTGNADDESGNGHNGEVHGPTLTEDRFGKPNNAYYFDGQNSYIALDMFYGTDDGTSAWTAKKIEEITVCAWVKSSSKQAQTIVSFDRSEYWRFSLKNWINQNEKNIGWSVTDVDGEIHDTTLNDYADGTWHFICAVHDSNGGGSVIYVDGEEEAFNSINKEIGTGFERWGVIGARSEASTFNGAITNSQDSYGGFFKGIIDEVMIFDEPLTQDTIKAIYKSNY